MAADDSWYYLGFDLSTQQLKCLAINETLRIIHTETITFDKELPHYKTHKGVYVNGDSIECPVAMWLEALDLLFSKFVSNGFDLSKVKAISGSCQQHGSVYWTAAADELLKNLRSNKGSLREQLSPKAFSRSTAPNWQDHSTGKQCHEFEAAVGGPQELARITGSRAHFRFTGTQILKIAEEEPDAYRDTAAISLVSSFLASLFTGFLTPLEEAEACGMNLYDIEKREFYPRLLELVDKDRPRIERKLMAPPIKCDKPVLLGNVCSYFVEKYGFNSDCSVFPFTGDNLATICSLPLEKNDVLVSLGTSTTILLVTDQYHPSADYHLFIHPTLPQHYMGMICYCNGALAREKVRDHLNNDTSQDWSSFNKAVLDEHLNNDDEVGVYFPLGEIVPSVPAIYKRAKFDPSTGHITKFVDNFASDEHDAKNIVEMQALSCRVRISPLLTSRVPVEDLQNDVRVRFDYDDFPLRDYYSKRPRRAFFVGGASKNDAIVKKFTEILGATKGNYRLETPNSCALGGCYKALWSDLYHSGQTSQSFDQFLGEKFPWNEVEHIGDSDDAAWHHYNKKIMPLSELESSLLNR
ncbi:probable Xylulose kinase [Zygosaccharomyces bailii]|nr:probable Xylulose kinase [Zygosaccharomyces bailii]